MPAINNKKRNRYPINSKPISYLLLFPSFLLLVSSITVPLFETYGFYKPAAAVHTALGLICHQLPTRCLRICGLPMGLCSRCFGIYLGLFIAGLYLTGERQMPKGIYLKSITLVTPLLIDTFTQLLKLRTSNNDMRLLTGLMFGLGMGMLISRMMLPFYEKGRILVKN